jgi:hypothetical protein
MSPRKGSIQDHAAKAAWSFDPDFSHFRLRTCGRSRECCASAAGPGLTASRQRKASYRCPDGYRHRWRPPSPSMSAGSLGRARYKRSSNGSQVVLESARNSERHPARRRTAHRPACDRGGVGVGATEFSGVWAYNPSYDFSRLEGANLRLGIQPTPCPWAAKREPPPRGRPGRVATGLGWPGGEAIVRFVLPGRAQCALPEGDPYEAASSDFLLPAASPVFERHRVPGLARSGLCHSNYFRPHPWPEPSRPG